MRQVSQNTVPVPETIKLKTTSNLCGTAILLTSLLKINFIFQILSIEKHSSQCIGRAPDDRITEVRGHTGNRDEPCETGIDGPCSDDSILKKLQTFYHEQMLCNLGNLAPVVFLYICYLFYMVVFSMSSKVQLPCNIQHIKGFLFFLIAFVSATCTAEVPVRCPGVLTHQS